MDSDLIMALRNVVATSDKYCDGLVSDLLDDEKESLEQDIVIVTDYIRELEGA